MPDEKIISVLIGKNEKVRFSLDADESFARNLVEQMDASNAFDESGSPAVPNMQLSFSGTGWRVYLFLGGEVAMDVRNILERNLMSEVQLPKMLREPEDVKRDAVTSGKPLSVWRRKINGFVDFILWLWYPTSPHGGDKRS